MNRPLEDDTVQIIKLIAAIFTLYNFLIDIQDATDIEPEEEDNCEGSMNNEIKNEDEEVEDDADYDDSPETRNILLQYMHWLEMDESS